jgi:hypothetical protein
LYVEISHIISYKSRRFYGAGARRAVFDTLLVTSSQVLIAILMNVAVFALLIETA